MKTKTNQKKLLDFNKKEVITMCDTMPGHCFSDKEKEKLEKLGWNKEQINFVENTKVENKIKELL